MGTWKTAVALEGTPSTLNSHPNSSSQPDTGRLEDYRVPGGPGIRLDGALTTGNVVSRFYDSLLSKVWGVA